MFCTNCGSSVPDSANFCTACGSAVQHAPAPPPPHARPQPPPRAPVQRRRQLPQVSQPFAPGALPKSMPRT